MLEDIVFWIVIWLVKYFGVGIYFVYIIVKEGVVVIVEVCV